MLSCTIDSVKARERVPMAFAQDSHILWRHKSSAPSTSDHRMMSDIPSEHKSTLAAGAIDMSPIRGTISGLSPITVHVVSQSDRERQ